MTNDDSLILSSNRNLLLNECKTQCQKSIERLILQLGITFKNLILTSPNISETNLNLYITDASTIRGLFQQTNTLNVLYDQNGRCRSPIQQDNDAGNVRICATILDVLLKYLKIAPYHLTVNQEFVSLLIEFASLPLEGPNIKPGSMKISCYCINTLSEIISYQSILSMNSQIVDLIYIWSCNFLQKSNKIFVEFNDFLDSFINFQDIFFPTYFGRYFTKNPQDFTYLSSYLSFIISLVFFYKKADKF